MAHGDDCANDALGFFAGEPLRRVGHGCVGEVETQRAIAKGNEINAYGDSHKQRLPKPAINADNQQGGDNADNGPDCRQNAGDANRQI